MNPAEKRLAVMVDDHPLDYGNFEGIIPQGHYGAGPVLLWDSGGFEPEDNPAMALKKGRLNFSLDGKKLKGGFALTLMKGRGTGKEWLLIKRRDSFAKKDWKVKQDLTPARERKLIEKIPTFEAS